ncbi:MAG: hypothetical protein Q3971_01365 [Moraxella sp.]|nr:hypothetical protein [Moraxella sp.]
MCFEVILSTNYPDDLSKFDTVGVYFEKIDNHKMLKYPNHYRVATFLPKNCGCNFRIYDETTLTRDLEHNPNALQEWHDETDDCDNVLNTKFLFQIIKNMVNQGYHLDSYVNDWDLVALLDEPPNKCLDIDVNHIKKDDFLFYIGHYFDFKK